MQIKRWREDSTLKTADKRQLILEQFEDWLDRDEPKMGDVIDYIKRLDRQPGTVRNHFYAVKDYFLWREKQEAETAQDYTHVNNIEEMLHAELEDHIKYSYEVSDDNFLTREQVTDIFDNTVYKEHGYLFRSEEEALKYRLLFGMMYYWARRVGECTALTWADVDLDAKVVAFIPEKKDDPDPISVDFTDPPEMEKWLVEFAEASDTTSDESVFDISNRTVRGKLAKVTGERCTTFDEPMGMTKAFRHSVASHLRADGVPMEVISQEVLHHKDISTTQDIYAGHITEAEKQAIDRSSLLDSSSNEPPDDDEEIQALVERLGIG